LELSNRTPEAICNALDQYIGTEQYWLCFPNNSDFKLTDGTKAMVELCDAMWLVTAIFSWQTKEKIRKEAFQLWQLQFNDKEKGDDAVLICEDGNDHEIVRQEIDYTDFPIPEGIKLYLDNGVLLLPSEY
jgi:hypothetical protein